MLRSTVLRFLVLLISASILAILSGCSVADVPPGDEPIATTFSGAILRLAGTTNVLPNSLLDPESRSQGKSASAKALGDATVITDDSISAARSYEWISVRRGDSSDQIATLVLQSIKGYAASHEIQEGAVFQTYDDAAGYLNVINPGTADTVTWTDTQKFKITGTVSEFTIFGHIAIIAVQGSNTINIDVYAEIGIDNSTPTPSMEMNMQYLGSINGGPTVFQFQIYGTKDGVTGEGNSVLQLNVGSSFQQHVAHTQISGSTVTQMSKILAYQGSSVDTTVLQVASGNDDIGGFLRTQDTLSNPSVNYLMTEFYDGNGDLIMNSDNDPTPYMFTSTADGTNILLLDASLAAAPETIRTKIEDIGGSWMISYEKAADVWVPFWKALPGNQYEVSTDGGVTWNAGSQTAGIELYYKQGTDWQVGDGAYNWLSEETVDSVQYTTYYLGQTVSEPVNFLGRNFYSTKRYPLKKLLPLTPAYASTYQIVQVEGTSNSMSWSDLEGNMHSALIPTYTYFLDGNDNEVFDGVGSGDIQLTTLNSYGGLTWNGTDFETVNIYMFMANIAPPPYFQNPETATVQALQSQLLSLASDANDLDFGVLSPNLKPLDSDPAFADLN